MPYSQLDDVKFWYRYSTGEDDWILRAITNADGMIDRHCHVPSGFFTEGGVEVKDEYHDGNEVAYHYSVSKVHEWLWDYDAFMLLAFKYPPVLSVVKVEEERTAGTWTERTEGSGSDYVVVEDGIHFLQNFPNPGYKNLRVTYVAGYAVTPENVKHVSARLAAAMLQKIKDAQTRKPTTTGAGGVSTPAPDSRLTAPVFTDELKVLLGDYVNRPYAGGFF